MSPDQVALPFEIGIDHHLDELAERGPRLPAQRLARLRRVADEVVDLRGAEELRPVWDRFRRASCFARLGDSQREWIALFSAVGERKMTGWISG